MQNNKPHNIIRKALYVVMYLVITLALILLDINLDTWDDQKFKNL